MGMALPGHDYRTLVDSDPGGGTIINEAINVPDNDNAVVVSEDKQVISGERVRVDPFGSTLPSETANLPREIEQFAEEIQQINDFIHRVRDLMKDEKNLYLLNVEMPLFKRNFENLCKKIMEYQLKIALTGVDDHGFSHVMKSYLKLFEEVRDVFKAWKTMNSIPEVITETTGRLNEVKTVEDVVVLDRDFSEKDQEMLHKLQAWSKEVDGIEIYNILSFIHAYPEMSKALEIHPGRHLGALIALFQKMKENTLTYLRKIEYCLQKCETANVVESRSYYHNLLRVLGPHDVELLNGIALVHDPSHQVHISPDHPGAYLLLEFAKRFKDIKSKLSH